MIIIAFSCCDIVMLLPKTMISTTTFNIFATTPLDFLNVNFCSFFTSNCLQGDQKSCLLSLNCMWSQLGGAGAIGSEFSWIGRHFQGLALHYFFWPPLGEHYTGMYDTFKRAAQYQKAPNNTKCCNLLPRLQTLES